MIETMVKEDLRFQIDQARKDKVIFAIEMVGSLAYLAVIPQFLDNFMGSIMGDAYFAGNTRMTVFKVASGLGLAFLLYVLFKSMQTLRKLRSLEKDLYKED